MINLVHFLAKPSLLFTALLLSFQSSVLANSNLITGNVTGATIAKDQKTGKVTFIGSNSPTGIKHPNPSTVNGLASTPPEKARNFVRTYAPLFGVAKPDTDLVAKQSFTLDGQPTVKYHQVYKGTKVFAAELNVNLDKTGNLLSMSGEAAPDLTLSTTPKVSAAKALSTALKVVEKQHKLTASSVNATTPELNIYQPGIIDPNDGSAKLVWLIVVTPKAIEPIEQIVLVNAVVPNTVVRTWNNSPHGRNRRTYTADRTNTLPGILLCNETTTGSNCTTGTSDSTKAHVYAGDIYNFYLRNHGRDSIDGAGMTITSTVQYRENYETYANAFWNSNQMVYGEGFVTDDVVAHEITHGVTEYTSNLLYYYQSGAINESFSDVWGEFVDLTNNRGNDSAAVRWKVGEELAGIGAIRDMKNPPLFYNPDKMTSPYYDFDYFFEDNGGVHTNSGINNKAVFLMTDGGTFNGKTITGLGIPKVAKIYYKVQTTLLTSGSSYSDLYNYLYQSCQSQIGTAGITVSDCTQVRNATLAVEMNKEPYAGYQPQAAVCSAGSAKNVFSDNMETSGKWQFLNLLGSNPWQYATGYTTSGKRTLYGKNVEAVTDSAARMTTGVAIPVKAYLHFKHHVDLEGGYDGGVLEYSIGTSNTWTDARPLFQAGQNYNGTISSYDSSPLAGRSAFTNFTPGYVSSRYNLASLAGKVVRFRFRQANDPAVKYDGWHVDDVRIYTCQ